MTAHMHCMWGHTCSDRIVEACNQFMEVAKVASIKPQISCFLIMRTGEPNRHACPSRIEDVGIIRELELSCRSVFSQTRKALLADGSPMSSCRNIPYTLTNKYRLCAAQVFSWTSATSAYLCHWLCKLQPSFSSSGLSVPVNHVN